MPGFPAGATTRCTFDVTANRTDCPNQTIEFRAFPDEPETVATDNSAFVPLGVAPVVTSVPLLTRAGLALLSLLLCAAAASHVTRRIGWRASVSRTE